MYFTVAKSFFFFLMLYILDIKAFTFYQFVWPTFDKCYNCMLICYLLFHLSTLRTLQFPLVSLLKIILVTERHH